MYNTPVGDQLLRAHMAERQREAMRARRAGVQLPPRQRRIRLTWDWLRSVRTTRRMRFASPTTVAVAAQPIEGPATP